MEGRGIKHSHQYDMTKCWFNLLHESPCEFIYFVRLRSSSQGHHRSWVQTGKERESVVWHSGESYLMIRCLMSHSEIVRLCIFTSLLAEWFIQIFPCDWSYCSRLKMTNDSEGFSFRHGGSSGRKRFTSFAELQLGTPVWQTVIKKKKNSFTLTHCN